VALPAVSPIARAQAYPTRPVRIIVGVAAGSTQDIVARLVGQFLSARMGQQFIVENRPGGGGNIATLAVVNAPHDGYTLLLVGAPNAINAAFYDKLNFNFMRDIAPVASIARVPLVMEVGAAFSAKTVPEFIAYAKANPGAINMASAGNGNPTHVAGELFKMMTGIDMVHVPYRGEAPAFADLIGGQVQLLFGGLPGAMPYIRAGTLRALALTTAERSEAVPEVPAMREFVPGYEASGWMGIGAPKGTSEEIVTTLAQEIAAVLADPKNDARLAELGAPVLTASPAEFARFIAQETEKWAKVVRFAGIKAD
jgi:tripartite-type tricarboxylate transporter receptor subunit TctC